MNPFVSPSSDPPPGSRSDQTRARILDATRQLLEARASDYVRISDIARLADVSPALVIRYFKSKDDLTYEVRLQQLEENYAAFQRHVKDNELAGDIEAILKARARFDLENANLVRDFWSMSWWWAEADERRVMEATKPLRKLFASALMSEFPRLAAAGEEAMIVHAEAIWLTYHGFLRHAIVMRTSLPAFKDALDRGVIAPLRAAHGGPV